MSSPTLLWWAGLCAVSALNVAAWLLSAAALRQQGPRLHPDDVALRRLQLLLSAGYVAGCAYRSALPVFDIPRQVLFDVWWSSAVVGRSVATVAELCFVAQWALLLRAASQVTGSRVGAGVARLLLPLIVGAEICSWHAVLSTANLGHVIEESLWGLCAALTLVAVASLWPRVDPSRRPLLLLCSAAAAAYGLYMFGVDVPMYWSRWLADQAQGRPYFDLAQGLADASSRWVVSHRWEDWRSEALWMSLYFSVAVWISVALVHAPHRAWAVQPPSRR